MNKPQSMESLAPLIEATVEAGGEFKLITRGTSMLPLLRNGVDTAVLVAPPKKLKKNDVPLYRRDDGSFVLHRAVSVSADGETFDARGDNQTVTERNIPVSSVIAVMTAVIVNGVRTDFSSEKYRKYVKKLPAHTVYLKVRRTAGKLLRKLKLR